MNFLILEEEWVDLVQLDNSSLTIGEMKIDSDGVLKVKCNDEWISVCTDTPTISNIHTNDITYAVKDTVSHYLDLHGLQEYDRKIKEYIDKRIEEKLSGQKIESKYKIMTGEE